MKVTNNHYHHELLSNSNKQQKLKYRFSLMALTISEDSFQRGIGLIYSLLNFRWTLSGQTLSM